MKKNIAGFPYQFMYSAIYPLNFFTFFTSNKNWNVQNVHYSIFTLKIFSTFLAWHFLLSLNGAKCPSVPKIEIMQNKSTFQNSSLAKESLALVMELTFSVPLGHGRPNTYQTGHFLWAQQIKSWFRRYRGEPRPRVRIILSKSNLSQNQKLQNSTIASW